MSGKHEYDVAFSFLKQDEQLAREMADRIRERVKVFIYSEQQKELIANDGVEAFSQVFRNEARVVVVLYRDDWGKTKWTRIEETAVKSRQLVEGFKFLVVVSLDGKHPVWYPDTWIWGDLERFGIDGLASVIEARIRETGGEVHPVSLSDRLAAEERRLTFESKRRTWRHQDSPQDALREFARLKDVCRRRIEGLNSATIKITQFNFGRESRLDLRNLHLIFRCEPTFANLDGTFLIIWIVKGGIPRGDSVHGETKTLENLKYQLILILTILTLLAGGRLMARNASSLPSLSPNYG